MITDREIADLLEDETKEIAGDIHWASYVGRAPAQIFSAPIQSAAGWPLRVHGSWNEATKRLTYAVIHAGAGRILGLDLGDKLIHHGPNCPRTRSAKSRCDCPRDAHMHRWTEQFGAAWIYAPSNVTAAWDDPVAAWRQFCAEINLAHRGILHEPERKQPWLPPPTSRR